MLGSVRALRLNSLLLNAKFSIAVNAIKHGDPKLLPLTKIVATIGPASENLPVLPSVVRAGMRIMRINFSHATYEEANLRVGNLKQCEGINHQKKAEDGSLNMRSILLDTQGPEIRTGSFGNGVKELDLVAGEKVMLTSDPSYQHNQSKDTVWVSYGKLYDTVKQGSSILLDDGIIEVQVESKQKSASGEAQILCTVVNSGTLGNKKGVNMPGLCVDLPAMSEKDREDIRWGIQNDIDYIAASFVRKPSDVTAIREYTTALLKELYPSTYNKYHVPKIISKIESTEALENFDEILDVSDGIMVARGDLAVEIPMETLATVSKEIVRRSALAGKPVIVATQMLESMQKNPRPTRAECTDVANAVIDGADCVMLSGESAKGKYPVGAVSMMNRIVLHTEHDYKSSNKLYLQDSDEVHYGRYSGLQSVARAAVTLASSMKDLSSIVINVHEDETTLSQVFDRITQTQELAALVSHHRPQVPILVAVPNHKIGRLLQMHRGIHPVLAAGSDAEVLKQLNGLELIKNGENVLVLSKSNAAKSVTSYVETFSA